MVSNCDAETYSTSYIYDLAGNRLSRTVHVSNSTVGSQTLTTTYSYDANTDRLLSETHTGPKWAVLLNDRPMYAYATNGGIVYKGSDGEMGEFKAFLFGLPTRWSQYGLRAVLVLLTITFILPAIMSFLRKQESIKAGQTKLSLFYRCLSIMLASMMLISPVCLQSLAEGANQYSDLDSRHWAQGDTTIAYGYDANGSMICKITKESGTETERVIYEYNLQNHLSKVKVSANGGYTWSNVTEYKYDPEGNRVEKIADGVSTKYLINARKISPVIPKCSLKQPEQIRRAMLLVMMYWRKRRVMLLTLRSPCFTTGMTVLVNSQIQAEMS